ncbi:hypothetical protein [Microvirga sp. VF16]|uniref:hypothetical protein n=1 Tax=Microvirga sp. VF16 TaxID=2807101 RepID=UPI00193D0EBF|nr:hypothetical protein [Microvirga sp. VF16]QRM36053.1 hypothetical protein JO965_45580 [Microvirga sp. VF16]
MAFDARSLVGLVMFANAVIIVGTISETKAQGVEQCKVDDNTTRGEVLARLELLTNSTFYSSTKIV